MSEEMSVVGSALVQACVERVWEIATDPRLAPRWNSNVVEVRSFSGVPVGEGTTWVQIVKILGKAVPMQARVTEWNPPVTGTVCLEGPGSPRVNTRLDPEVDGVRLTQVMKLVPPSGLAGVGMRLARSTIERELQEALRRQKIAAEEEP